MGDANLTQGDTFPALRFAAEDKGKLLPIATAEKLEFIAVGKDRVFEGTAVAIDPPEEVGVDDDAPNGYNGEYELAADDTELPEEPGFVPWLRVTWAPGKVQWVRCGDKIPVAPEPDLS